MFITDKVLLQYLDFFLLISELNAKVSTHSNVFYPATSTLKNVICKTFSGEDLLEFACCVGFSLVSVFLTNFLTFYDFPLLLCAIFPIH